jgi:hypothetical protein
MNSPRVPRGSRHRFGRPSLRRPGEPMIKKADLRIGFKNRLEVRRL